MCRFYVNNNVIDVCKLEIHRRRQDFDEKFAWTEGVRLITIVMPPGPVSCIGGTKYPHCIVLYCIVLKLFY